MWHEFDTEEHYIKALVDTLMTQLQTAIKARGRACMAVSGGRSPIALFERLNRAEIDWANVHLCLVDERFVPADSEDSNERLVRCHLMVNKAAQASFTGLITDPHDMQRCLAQANQSAIKPDIAILGMGDDGHTASLFPGAPQLAQALAPDQTQHYVSVTPPSAPHQRISMTLRALLDSRRLILTISGAHKRAVYEQAAQRTSATLPISFLISQDRVPLEVYWHG